MPTTYGLIDWGFFFDKKKYSRSFLLLFCTLCYLFEMHALRMEGACAEEEESNGAF
jgi:hypothetical protein